MQTDMKISSDHQRASLWKIRGKDLLLPPQPLLMAIVNATPDSFSDGGQFAVPDEKSFQINVSAAVDYALHMIQNGAAIIDLGGQSTRPGSKSITPEEELQRVLPILKELTAKTDCPISIDTTSALVARECAKQGAAIINDISGGTFEPDIINVVRQYHLGFCVCHIQGIPETMQKNPTYENVASDVFDWLKRRRDALEDLGIARQQIALDPGLGFGKSFEQNIELIQKIETFHELQCPLLVGHSRKSMFRDFFLKDQIAANHSPADQASFADQNEEKLIREILTTHLSRFLEEKQIQILRIHQTAANRAALDFDRLIRQ